MNERIKDLLPESDEPRLKERGQSKTYCCYWSCSYRFQWQPTQWWAGMDCAQKYRKYVFAAHSSLGIGSVDKRLTVTTWRYVHLLLLGVPKPSKLTAGVAPGWRFDSKNLMKEKSVKDDNYWGQGISE